MNRIACGCCSDRANYVCEPVPASGQNPARTSEFRYDASGSRVQRLGPDGDTVYVGGVFEQSGTDTKTYYSFAGATVAVRDKTPSSDDRYYLVSDLVGTNSMQIKYERTGGSHDRFAQYYFPYGAKRASWDNTSGSGSAVRDRGFTGQVSDSALTGLLFYNARYYDPALRRFISADTIVPNPGNPQDLNRYTYVGNNPTTYDDPSGHCTRVTDDGVCVIHANGVTYRANPDGTTTITTTDPLVADQVEGQHSASMARSVNENNPGVTVYTYQSYGPSLSFVDAPDRATAAARRARSTGNRQGFGDATLGEFASVEVGDVDLMSGELNTGRGTPALVFDVSAGPSIPHDIRYGDGLDRTGGGPTAIVWADRMGEDGRFRGRVVLVERTLEFDPQGAMVGAASGCATGAPGGLKACLVGAAVGIGTSGFEFPTVVTPVRGPWEPR